jgi:hypothetical protein
MSVHVHFLNPFGCQEAKLWLFNISYYKGNSNYQFNELTIDILNVTFCIEWPWSSKHVGEIV